jgi:hypothetical protein
LSLWLPIRNTMKQQSVSYGNAVVHSRCGRRSSSAAHYFEMGQAVGCDKFAVANAGTPIGSKNGVPALRLSHPTKYSDSTNALPLLVRSLASSRDRVRISRSIVFAGDTTPAKPASAKDCRLPDAAVLPTADPQETQTAISVVVAAWQFRAEEP